MSNRSAVSAPGGKATGDLDHHDGAERQGGAAPEGEATLEALYVLRGHQGTGLADRMIVAAFARLGDQAMRLEVATHDVRAIRFYERHGFRLTGETDVFSNQVQSRSCADPVHDGVDPLAVVDAHRRVAADPVTQAPSSARGRPALPPCRATRALAGPRRPSRRSVGGAGAAPPRTARCDGGGVPGELVGAVLAILVLTQIGAHGAGGLNLVPGAGLRDELGNVNRGLAVVNVAGNAALFVPAAFLAPLALGWRFGRTFAGGVLLSVAVEVFQAATGRSGDIDDVLLNGVGALIGAALGTTVTGTAWWRSGDRAGRAGAPDPADVGPMTTR